MHKSFHPPAVEDKTFTIQKRYKVIFEAYVDIGCEVCVLDNHLEFQTLRFFETTKGSHCWRPNDICASNHFRLETNK